MKRTLKCLLSTLLAVYMLSAGALAAGEAPQAQPISPWAYDAMSEVAALGMWDDSYYYCILDEITDQQLDALCRVVSAKLALLDAPLYTPEEEIPLVIDHTRGGVINALYQQVAAWEFPSVAAGPVDCLVDLQVIQGAGASGDLALERPCSLQEALVMAQRLVLRLYDLYGAGSQGLLWKAVNGENTLYLLGTIHVDRDNIYPFTKQLRDIIATSDDAVFEVDFGDTEDIQAFAAMQFYTDGTTLKDHVSAETYDRAVAAAAALPAPYTMDEEMVSTLKPWVLANSFNSVSLLIGEDSLESPMAVDMYVYSKASNNGVTIGAVESYVYQAGLFDGLSQAYQEAYLTGMLDGYEAILAGEASSDVATISEWVGYWKSRDAEAFAGSYDKDAQLAGEDEMNVLFTDRDPNMIAYADGYLKAETPHTGILVVGAGHMVGDTGIVQGLKDLGYTVELVSVE